MGVLTSKLKGKNDPNLYPQLSKHKKQGKLAKSVSKITKKLKLMNKKTIIT